MYNKMDHRINKFQHRFFEERLEGVGISGPVGGYLMVIFEKKTMKMNDLIEDLPFHKSHATRAINRLQELGYIIKTVDSEDARGYILAITESGKAAASKVIETFNQWQALINSALSKEEIAMLDQISEKIYQKIALYYGEDVTHEKDL